LALGVGLCVWAAGESAIAAAPQATASDPAPASGGLPQVAKGVTTQADLIRLFGGPNLTSRDAQGREVWVYEHTVTQTDARAATNSASGNVDFSLFWGGSNQAGAGVSASKSATTLSTGSAIRSTTVVVTFAADHTVLDYTVKANYF
jgi:hypothetical protein